MYRATTRARACFNSAAKQAQRAAGTQAVSTIQRLQRQVWDRARSRGAKRLVLGGLIQGNTPDGMWFVNLGCRDLLQLCCHICIYIRT